MEALIKELKIAIENKLYLTAINTALIIPDICSALQSPNGKTNGQNYSKCFNDFVGDKYVDFILGSDVYKLRCASLHQGKFNYDYENFDKILFQPSGNMVIHQVKSSNCGETQGTLILLKIETFISDII